MASQPKSNIAALRRRAKMTQLELSQKVGVTETTIANWEKNRGGGLELIERFIRLCEALQCQPQDLISYESSSAAPQFVDTSLEKIHKKLGVSDPAPAPMPDELTANNSASHAQKKGKDQTRSPG